MSYRYTTRRSLVFLDQTVLQAFDAEHFIELREEVQSPYHRVILDAVHQNLRFIGGKILFVRGHTTTDTSSIRSQAR